MTCGPNSDSAERNVCSFPTLRMSVSGDFDLTGVNELDYSSTKTDQNEAGAGDLRHGRIAATKVASLDPIAGRTTGSAKGSGDIVRGSMRILTDTQFTRIVGKRTSSRRGGGYGQTASFS